MSDEIRILEKMLPQMAEVINVNPNESFRMKECDTLLILQRRMKESDLSKELLAFNDVFAEKDGCSLKKLQVAATSLVKIRVLVERDEENYSPVVYRELIKEYKAQCTKVVNIIHLSEVNSLTADDFIKEKIELTVEKNEAFLEAYQNEISILEKKIERMPKTDVEEETEVKEHRYKPEEIKTVTSVEEKQTFIDKVKTKIDAHKNAKAVDIKLKEVEKEDAKTRCVEIPYYEKNLVFTEVICCKDIPEYSILKRRNNIYFGLTRNVGAKSYDNRDQSLIELTEATDDFIQFMSVDLLGGDYELTIFSRQEKEALKMYFNFVSGCFRKSIGVILSVQEYLKFKSYYNRLVLKMFEMEKQEKEDYYKALILADIYIRYMESYDLACSEDEETIIRNLMEEKYGSYVDDLDLISNHHVVDEDARADLEEIKNRMKNFHEKEPTEVVISEVEDPIVQENIGMIAPVYPNMMIPYMPGTNFTQIVVQILNQNREIVDEAIYAGANMKQALCDYETKGGYIKRLGFRNNGQDVFCKEEKEME